MAPLANTFSRSSSTSTITNNEQVTKPTSPSPLASATTLVNDTNGIGTYELGERYHIGSRYTAASEASAVPPSTPLKPGILIITLHEGRSFSLPAGAEQAFQPRGHGSSLSSGGGFSVAGSARPGSSSVNQGGIAGSYAGGRSQTAQAGINAVPTIHGRYSSKYLPYALIDFDKQQVFINAVSGTPENPVWAGESTQYKFDVSRVTELSISLYIRNPNAPPQAGRSEDIFLGLSLIHI